jgi:hypothetical protein
LEGISENEIDLIVQLIRDLSSSDDMTTEQNREGEIFIRYQSNTLNLLFPLDSINPTLMTPMRFDPILQPNMIKTVHQMAEDLAIDLFSNPEDNIDTSYVDKQHNVDFSSIQGVIDVSAHPNLNAEQNFCLQRCIQYFLSKDEYIESPEHSECPSPFKLILHGGPGTGKTRLADAIVSRMHNHGLQVSCAAPTGVAASLLPGGRTLHNLLGLPPRDPKRLSFTTFKSCSAKQNKMSIQ